MEKPTEMPEGPLFHMDITEIMQILPHRYPFLLVDRVTALEPGKFVQGYKNISMNEPFFQGHFPNNPIMPGVLIVEALAQLGCIMVSQLPAGKGKLGLFTGIDNLRFRRPVRPGDRLDMYAELQRFKGPIGKAYVKATVDGELVAEGQVMFSFVPKPETMTNGQ